MALANGRTDRFACLEQFSTSIDKVSFKKNSMSLGFVVLEEKLFTHRLSGLCSFGGEAVHTDTE